MNQKSMNPYTDIDAAIRAIKAFDGSPEDFCLPISVEIQDSLGMSMAIITDVILGKGWDVDGFDQKDGYRVYRYKSPD